LRGNKWNGLRFVREHGYYIRGGSGLKRGDKVGLSGKRKINWGGQAEKTYNEVRKNLVIIILKKGRNLVKQKIYRKN